MIEGVSQWCKPSIRCVSMRSRGCWRDPIPWTCPDAPMSIAARAIRIDVRRAFRESSWDGCSDAISRSTATNRSHQRRGRSDVTNVRPIRVSACCVPQAPASSAPPRFAAGQAVISAPTELVAVPVIVDETDTSDVNVRRGCDQMCVVVNRHLDAATSSLCSKTCDRQLGNSVRRNT